MIIEIYILIEVLILGLLFIGWIKEHPIFWILANIFAAIQIFSSYNIEYIVFSSDTLGNVISNVQSFSFPILSYINIMLFMIAMLMFFWDIFNPKETVVNSR